MYNAKIFIDRLAADHTLAADEYLYILSNTDAQTLAYINNVAAVPCVPCRYAVRSTARAALFGGHARCPAEEETEAAD